MGDEAMKLAKKDAPKTSTKSMPHVVAEKRRAQVEAEEKEVAFKILEKILKDEEIECEIDGNLPYAIQEKNMKECELVKALAKKKTSTADHAKEFEEEVKAQLKFDDKEAIKKLREKEV